jgi:hypothetical protein
MASQTTVEPPATRTPTPASGRTHALDDFRRPSELSFKFGDTCYMEFSFVYASHRPRGDRRDTTRRTGRTTEIRVHTTHARDSLTLS